MKFAFYFILMLPGYQPITFEQPVESLAACLYEQFVFGSKPPNKLLIEGGLLNIGCSITYPRSMEH